MTLGLDFWLTASKAFPPHHTYPRLREGVKGVSFSISETDVWPRVAAAIEVRRMELLHGFLHATDYMSVVRVQGQIDALEWVLAEARPKPVPRRDEEEE